MHYMIHWLHLYVLTFIWQPWEFNFYLVKVYLKSLFISHPLQTSHMSSPRSTFRRPLASSPSSLCNFSAFLLLKSFAIILSSPQWPLPLYVYIWNMSMQLMEGGERPFLSTKRLPVPDPWTVYYATPKPLTNSVLCSTTATGFVSLV